MKSYPGQRTTPTTAEAAVREIYHGADKLISAVKLAQTFDGARFRQLLVFGFSC